jgi:AcrR family transcriptional regulator
LPDPSARRKQDRYHHGDLRAALIEAAIELMGERGVRNFSLAEVSRRLGVAVSAPYAHFSERDDLLAAVAVRAYELFYAALEPATLQFSDPSERLAAMARSYVRYAAAHRPLFELLYTASLDKHRYPEIEAAEQPLMAAFLDCVHALCEGDEALSYDLATAVEVAAYGHAMALLAGDFGQGEEAVEQAADRAERATLALVAGRELLRSSPPPDEQSP